jgi:hypothetical protein
MACCIPMAPAFASGACECSEAIRVRVIVELVPFVTERSVEHTTCRPHGIPHVHLLACRGTLSRLQRYFRPASGHLHSRHAATLRKTTAIP